jgi:hypothetical protein
MKLGIIALLALNSPAFAAGPAHYLIAGGGFYAGHSEVVLEKNVELFRETAQMFRIPASSQFTLFASGTDTSILDIVEIDQTVTQDEKLFALLFGKPGQPEVLLRHNHLPDLLGASNGPNLVQQLKDAAAATSATKPFRFYYTGHGAPARSFFPPPPILAPGVIVPIGSVSKTEMIQYRHNYMALWDRTSLNAPDFSTLLDGFAADTPVQTVMVQCFSGGFAQMIFEKGDPSAPLTQANRCGFYATVPSRVAAGCSPDINHREEYSPYFLAAVRGKTEKGQVVDADYDQNGVVTSDEGHAFVILNENAIDVPITTSSQMLREVIESVPATALTADWSWYKSRLTKTERAIAEGLAHLLAFDLERGPLVPTIRDEIKKTSLLWGDAKTETGLKSRALVGLLQPIFPALAKDHPIFAEPYPAKDETDPVVLKAVADARAALLGHPDYPAIRKAYLDMQQASVEAGEVQHKLAKWERLGYLLETKAFEESLKAASNTDWKKKYQQLKSCEGQTFFQ